MASLENQKGWYRIVFRYAGQKFQRALDTQDERQALFLKSRVEENLRDLKRGRLVYRPGDDLITLLLSDGKLNAIPEVGKPVSLGKLLKDYRRQAKVGKEENTRYTERIHIKHLLRLMGRRTPVAAVTDAKLQEYVNRRSQEKGRRGEPVSHVTIRKELSTLSSIWNRWATREKLVSRPLTLKNIDYPKHKEKPPFQTWEQVLRKTKGDPRSELWDSVYLNNTEIEELLAHIRQAKYRWKNSRFPWIFPMFAFCTYTGARRSEMLRSRVEDFDFERSEVTVREKKKDAGKKETYRHVPMTAKLREVMRDWLGVHPGGQVMFCSIPDEPFSAQMAHHYFRWAVEGSKWGMLRGFHCLRHSVISLLACQGVPERVLMQLVGHLNAETTRRYAHLFPSTAHMAMETVFGKAAFNPDPPGERTHVRVGNLHTKA